MKELILLVAGHRLGGVEVREADFHFRVQTAVDGSAAAPLASPPPVAADPAATAAPPVSAAAPAPVAPAAPEPPPEPPGHKLTSPIVGTFYAAPSPDAEAYVRV